ncbi:MAG: hypothetical protein ACI9OI_001402 [Chitinophagales bacterium]|jgi:hypothetical protein
MLTADKINRLRAFALTEKQLVNRLVSPDGTAAMINISLELPPEVDPMASKERQAAQREPRDSSHPEVVYFGRQLLAEYRLDCAVNVWANLVVASNLFSLNWQCYKYVASNRLRQCSGDG